MGFKFQFSYVLLVGIAVVSVFTTIGFLNNANAANVNMNDNVTMNSNMNGNMSMTHTQNMTNSQSMMNSHNMTNIQKILSPLQQFKSGVTAKSVQCNAGLTLIIKAEDGSPACVTSQTAQTLTARGWGTAP